MIDRGPTLRGAGLLRYLREAFLYRWNLLALLGGAGAALIGPSPDVFLPLVFAVELLYLGGLTSMPRFRAAIDAKAHAEREGAASGAGGAQARSVEALLAGLDGASRQRFERLRARCLDMQRLAHGVRGNAADVARTDEMRTPALDRLLWAFLRLLFSQHALARFRAGTDEAEIRRGLADLRARQEQARARGEERILRSLADSIATAELRLENHRKAVSNAEYVEVELERIEGKIKALTELAVGGQDADGISAQVDTVAESMVQAEDAIREINQITGLTDDLAEAPPILAEGRGR
jgi:hypothetical protein